MNLLEWQYKFINFINLNEDYKFIILSGNCHSKSLLLNYIINHKKFIKIIYYHSIPHFDVFIKNHLNNDSFIYIIISDDYIISNFYNHLIYNYQVI